LPFLETYKEILPVKKCNASVFQIIRKRELVGNGIYTFYDSTLLIFTSFHDLGFLRTKALINICILYFP